MEKEDKITKTSEISIKVGTNENNVPVRMKWSAQDGNIENAEASSMFLSVWDPKEKNTMKIDLWTKELSIEEMKQFFHQTLVTMADTFERATGEKNISEDLRDYCYHFAEKMDILPED
ncbi:gliding motility protein GldC [Brumimicrobium salinarum]|uniref:Gliding motility protein GldC n=1 Tax=Brumimicrobium salinarum TaxID=2058658 RepID=A0A2I0R1W1_9FLAO|nr:gliding motility protein GldC [Brumimicrobium salinarum]PKR80563.1 gliding motility protein GldC [Brumimicrobium salinarum]